MWLIKSSCVPGGCVTSHKKPIVQIYKNKTSTSISCKAVQDKRSGLRGYGPNASTCQSVRDEHTQQSPSNSPSSRDVCQNSMRPNIRPEPCQLRSLPRPARLPRLCPQRCCMPQCPHCNRIGYIPPIATFSLGDSYRQCIYIVQGCDAFLPPADY